MVNNTPELATVHLAEPGSSPENPVHTQEAHPEGAAQLIQNPLAAPSSFKANGYEYTLEKVGGKSSVYAQSKKGGHYAYEVIIHRTSKARSTKFANPDGTTKVVNFPSKFQLPTNEDFGKWAWSYTTAEQALKHYENYEKEERPK